MRLFICGLLLLTACENDRTNVRRVLEAEGYTNIVVGGWSMFGCGRDDSFANAFSAKKGERNVGGWGKGLTIRLEARD